MCLVCIILEYISWFDILVTSANVTLKFYETKWDKNGKSDYPSPSLESVILDKYPRIQVLK